MPTVWTNRPLMVAALERIAAHDPEHYSRVCEALRALLEAQRRPYGQRALQRQLRALLKPWQPGLP